MDRERVPSAKESYFFPTRSKNQGGNSNQPNPKCLHDEPKSQTTTREIQPQTQALKPNPKCLHDEPKSQTTTREIEIQPQTQALKPNPKCLHDEPKSETTTREIQPQTQALKLLLQKMEWPQFQPNFKASWMKPKIVGATEAAAEKASEEKRWLVEQYLWFIYATRQKSIASELESELGFYFSMYHLLLDVTDIQNPDDFLKEVQHLLLTQEHKHAILTNALEESEEQLVAKREELKLLLKDQEGDGTAQVG